MTSEKAKNVLGKFSSLILANYKFVVEVHCGCGFVKIFSKRIAEALVFILKVSVIRQKDF